jgi:hypothetical protein
VFARCVRDLWGLHSSVSCYIRTVILVVDGRRLLAIMRYKYFALRQYLRVTFRAAPFTCHRSGFQSRLHNFLLIQSSLAVSIAFDVRHPNTAAA